MNTKTYTMQGSRPMSLDGVSSPRAAQMQRTSLAPATAIRRPVYSRVSAAPPKPRIWQKLQLPMLMLAGTMGGFFADNLAVGLALISAYGITAFVTRISSRTTFTLALILLGAISVMLLFKPSALAIRNFSTYAFVLLMVGVITLGREARLPKRMPRKYRR